MGTHARTSRVGFVIWSIVSLEEISRLSIYISFLLLLHCYYLCTLKYIYIEGLMLKCIHCWRAVQKAVDACFCGDSRWSNDSSWKCCCSQWRLELGLLTMPSSRPVLHYVKTQIMRYPKSVSRDGPTSFGLGCYKDHSHISEEAEDGETRPISLRRKLEWSEGECASCPHTVSGKGGIWNWDQHPIDLH